MAQRLADGLNPVQNPVNTMGYTYDDFEQAANYADIPSGWK